MNVVIREFDERDTEQVVHLWETCGLTRPWNDPRADIARKLAVQPELFLVADDASGAGVVASVMAGYDGHRGWLYYLATAPERRGKGLARTLVAEAERRLHAIGCPKVQLMVRADNEAVGALYAGLGYENAEVSVLGKRLIDDLPASSLDS